MMSSQDKPDTQVSRDMSESTAEQTMEQSEQTIDAAEQTMDESYTTAHGSESHSETTGDEIQAPGEKTSIDSIPDVMPPPVMSSTPPTPFVSGLDSVLGSDTSDDAMDRLETFHANELQKIKEMRERRKRQRIAMQSTTVKLELNVDSKYEMKDYDLATYKQEVPDEDYYRVSLAKMGYHIIKSAESYEEAFGAMSHFKGGRAQESAGAEHSVPPSGSEEQQVE